MMFHPVWALVTQPDFRFSAFHYVIKQRLSFSNNIDCLLNFLFSYLFLVSCKTRSRKHPHFCQYLIDNLMIVIIMRKAQLKHTVFLLIMKTWCFAMEINWLIKQSNKSAIERGSIVKHKELLVSPCCLDLSILSCDCNLEIAILKFSFK